MMLEPSIDQLQEKIYSKYELVTLSARRARQLAENKKSMVEEPSSHTFVGVALEEIADGKLYIAEEE
ncbi:MULTISPECIES: DNA-directed RNA polymerase subunit omega [unclassified Oceanobacillus]|uniref:DNA-directed RNA polymerase subunit omega n=1 Tax=unclassified Oceanobacillus TaxID=2630292 RepID=UPI0012EBBD36|nr:DNA-directed RNA polymerase subunit omega [Oceanobacillus sp. AG]